MLGSQRRPGLARKRTPLLKADLMAYLTFSSYRCLLPPHPRKAEILKASFELSDCIVFPLALLLSSPWIFLLFSAVICAAKVVAATPSALAQSAAPTKEGRPPPRRASRLTVNSSLNQYGACLARCWRAQAVIVSRAASIVSGSLVLFPVTDFWSGCGPVRNVNRIFSDSDGAERLKRQRLKYD